MLDHIEFLKRVVGPVLTIDDWSTGERQRRSVPTEDVDLGTEQFFHALDGERTCLISDSDEREIRLPPSFSVETSKGRFDNYWLVDEPVSTIQAETLLAYLDPLSPLASPIFRLPGSISVKHGSKFRTRLVVDDGKVYSLAQIYAVPPPEVVVGQVDESWVGGEPFPDAEAVMAFLTERDVSRAIRGRIEKEGQKAGTVLNALIKTQRVSVAEAIRCVEVLPCNPYRSWKYGGRRELAKLIVVGKATTRLTSMAAAINTIRKKDEGKKGFEVRNDVSASVLKDLKEQCTLLHAKDGTKWAVDKHTGGVMEIGRHMGPISHFLNGRYGLNPVDQEHGHVIEDLLTTVGHMPPTADTTSISFYDRRQNTMSVSFGGREILVLSADGTSTRENGANGLIFRSPRGADPVATNLLHVDRALDDPIGSWWNRLLPPETFSNLVKGDPEEISTLLYVWILFFMFRAVAESRPILALLGQAGSGKSTLAKIIHLLIYGRGVGIFELGNIEDWMTTTSNYPLVMWDNLDTPTPGWLPRKLATSITPMTRPKRALWTNNDAFIQRCDAMVGVSAHDASFLKDDVIDRMILVQFDRIDREKRQPEDTMLLAIEQQREALLAGLLADVIRVLGTPRPKNVGSPIRIVDFTSVGLWIARANGKEDVFLSALGQLASHQKSRTIEEDAVLVEALETVRLRSRRASEWMTHAQIWIEIMTLSDDEGASVRNSYRDASGLGRKLAALYTHLREAIGLEQKRDERHDWMVYRLSSTATPPRERMSHEVTPRRPSAN